MPNIGNYHQRLIGSDIFIGKIDSFNDRFAIRKSYDIIKKMNDIRNTLLLPCVTLTRSEIYNKNFDHLCHFIKARIDVKSKISINLAEIEGKSNHLIELKNNGFLLLDNNEINFSKAMYTFSYLYHQVDEDKQAILQKEIADKIFFR